MPLLDATLHIGVQAMQDAMTFFGLATADPGATGANPTTHARVAAGWGTPANGDFGPLTLPKLFTGGAANGPVLYVTFWSAATAGTFRGSYALTGDTTSNSAGEYTLTAGAIAGTST
jgi:hypothetical protein